MVLQDCGAIFKQTGTSNKMVTRKSKPAYACVMKAIKCVQQLSTRT